jgi:hypothetical protein
VAYQTPKTINRPQTAPLPHMREWESLTYEQEGPDWMIVSFHSRIAKEEVEKHVPTGYYAPPTWNGWNGLHGKGNPVYRADGLYVWLLLRKRKG